MYAAQKTKKLVNQQKNLFNKKNYANGKKKHSTPEIPAWSPTAVLIGPKGA